MLQSELNEAKTTLGETMMPDVKDEWSVRWLRCSQTETWVNWTAAYVSKMGDLQCVHLTAEMFCQERTLHLKPNHEENNLPSTFGNTSSFVLNWGSITSRIFGGGSQVYSSNTDSCSQTAFKLTSHPECAMCEVAVSFVITRGKEDYGGGRQERVVLIFISRLNVRSPPLLCPTLQYLEVASFICCRSIGRKCSQNPASLQMTQNMYHQMHFTNEAPTIHHDSPICGVKNDLKMTVQTLKKKHSADNSAFLLLNN